MNGNQLFILFGEMTDEDIINFVIEDLHQRADPLFEGVGRNLVRDLHQAEQQMPDMAGTKQLQIRILNMYANGKVEFTTPRP